ncbi:Gfo/Idh/MocA family oxidoreductase [candidate division KSB1 bacterium]|nr:Gfo/Idh/MocA family oxidoreductase [candidate division KSB1 bacterium]
MENQISRREFMKRSSLAASSIAVGAMSMSAKSYARIIGANERINFAIVGLHGRGKAHLSSISKCDNAVVTHICDVDKRELDLVSAMVNEKYGQLPVTEKDIRNLVEDKSIDAITIASPEHWHTPMAIMGLEAGKHVYIEKPCSHNPREGELLIKAQQKYNRLVQLGNQQRSCPTTQGIIKRIHSGLIGRVYYCKAWYSNTRTSIGVGKEVPVPDYLDWELWQGPAPRRQYKDNIHPYNWHWFWHWGAGETLNNGTHEVDISRWALQVGYPQQITATGGRYHDNDDWEFYDTLITNFEYGDEMIAWEGLSCQGKKYYNRGRGTTVHGTEGTVLIDRDGFIVFDRDENVVEEYKKPVEDASMDIVGAGPMTTWHFQNFINAIRMGEKLNSPIYEGNVAVTMLQLSNIAWKTRRSLQIDPANGHIRHDKKAMQMWSREYENGWEPKV